MGTRFSACSKNVGDLDIACAPLPWNIFDAYMVIIMILIHLIKFTIRSAVQYIDPFYQC